jgi:hypothetical protein
VIEGLSKLSVIALSKREDAPEKETYAVIPRDGKNTKELEKTEKFLKDYLGEEEDYQDSLIMDDKLWYWVCTRMLHTFDTLSLYIHIITMANC